MRSLNALRNNALFGRTSVSTLDAQGRILAVDVPGLASSALTYDDHGRLVAMIRGRRSWTRSYDGATGLLESLTDPLGRVTSFDAYDLARRLLSQTLPGDRALNFAYDASGNQTLIGVPAVGDPPTSVEHAFAYTSIGQLASYDAPDLSQSIGLIQYDYDVEGCLTTMARPDGIAVTHTCDAAGRLEATAPNIHGEWESEARTGDPDTGEVLRAVDTWCDGC